MNSRALHSGSKLCQDGGCERKWLFKYQRLRHLHVRKERERDFWGEAFLAPETRPECSVDDRFNCRFIGLGSELLLTALACCREMFGKVSLDGWCDCPGRLVSRLADGVNGFAAHHFLFCSAPTC